MKYDEVKTTLKDLRDKVKDINEDFKTNIRNSGPGLYMLEIEECEFKPVVYIELSANNLQHAAGYITGGTGLRSSSISGDDPESIKQHFFRFLDQKLN